MFGIDKELVRLHFDRGAATYDEYAEVQAVMAERVAARLPSAQKTSFRVIEIGCGTGRLSERLVARMPDASFTFVDLSEAMLARTRERIHAAGMQATCLAADAEQWTRPGTPLPAGAPFDLLVSGATVQWFEQPPQATAALAQALLAPGGSLIFSTFGPGTFSELHEAYRIAERRLGLPNRPHGLPMATADDWQRAFAEAGLPLSLQEEKHVLHYPNVRSFLRSVQRVGAGNALRPVREEDAAASSLAGRPLLQAMEQAYAELYTEADGSIRATYTIFYGITKLPCC